MEESKYYTPELEEFYVGFEFEFSGVDSYWNAQPFTKHKVLKTDKEYFGLFTLEWVMKIFNGDDNGKRMCRVKYLDRSDIEELGWKMNGKIYELGNYTLEFCSNEHGIWLLIRDEFAEYQHFSGRVKNKSELKKLMKMLGI